MLEKANKIIGCSRGQFNSKFNSISGTVKCGDIFRDGILGGGTLAGDDACTRNS